MSLGRCCRLLGVTRQAYYQHFWDYEEDSLSSDLIIQEVKSIRFLHPVIGVRKLYVMLQSFLLEHQIKIGRDALFDLLAAHKLLVRKRKRSIRTTNSNHWLRKYPNLIVDMVPCRANELWVADITYFKVGQKHVYISFITDAYSKKIVGYNVANTLETVSSVQALEMAIKQNEGKLQGLIHHSDRGVQYCANEYTRVLLKHHIHISMTENSDPRENAIAERINGIMKEEYLNHYILKNCKEVQKQLEQAVILYNSQRPHMSCNMITPNIIHENNIKTQKLWKNYYQQKTIIVNPL